MSPQSRARSTISENTGFTNPDDDRSGNPCPGTSFVSVIARAANIKHAHHLHIHKIESESSATPVNPLNQASDGGTLPSPKRSSSRISSSPKSQPFLSSYGSAFLSGIFADIAQASDDLPKLSSAVAQASAVQTANTCNEPCTKKARTTALTSFGRQLKSHIALDGLAEGVISEVHPSDAPPRLNTSTHNIQNFNDQVRELQDMAFPSLPQLPTTVSSSSFSTASVPIFSPCSSVAVGGMDLDDQDSPSYGWFVSTDVDETDPPHRRETLVSSMFLPDSKPDLAFKTVTAPRAGNQDLVVQQALAADTIDDVLGDLF
jgi:hypothetical protein